MTDSCALYISKKNVELVSFLANFDDTAKVNFLTSEKASELEKVEIIWSDLKITINRMGRTDSRFSNEIEGLSNYIFHLSEQKINPRTFTLLEMVQRTNNIFGLEIEPSFDPQKRWIKLITGLAGHLKGLILHDFCIYDPNFKLFLGKNGEINIDSRLPVFESSLIRKKAMEDKIKKLDICLNLILPPTISAEEVILKDSQEVAQRASILALVASRAAVPKSDPLIKVLRKEKLINFLTDDEVTFLEIKKPEKEKLIKFSWRFESCYVLMWALGFFDSLNYPDSICNTKELVSLINTKTIAEINKNPKLRAVEQILDELDFMYRLHWAVKNDTENPNTARLIPEVIYERHYALNWLINYMNKPWDQVQTNT